MPEVLVDGDSAVTHTRLDCYEVRFSLRGAYNVVDPYGSSGDNFYLQKFRGRLIYRDLDWEDREDDDSLPLEIQGLPQRESKKESGTYVVGKLTGLCFPYDRFRSDPKAPWAENVFDSHSQDAYDFYAAFFDGNRIKNVVARQVPDLRAGLVITYIEIHPAHRGKDLGILMLKALREVPFLPLGTVLALQPDAFGHPPNSVEFEVGTRKVISHFRKAGFKRFGRTNFLWSVI